MKVFNTILSILFTVFALVQINDPDPWMWVALYGFVALVSGLAAFGKYSMPVLLSGLMVTLIGLGLLFPDLVEWIKLGMPSIADSMKAEADYIELTREFFGLVLVLIALIFLIWQSRRVRSRR